MHTHEMLESKDGFHGMESHVSYPAVYSATKFDHAATYALPSCPFDDNLYAAVVLELEVQPPYTFYRKSRRGLRIDNSEKVLSTSTGVTVVALHLLYNLHIAQGDARMHAKPSKWEILPPDFAERVKNFDGQSGPAPFKRHNWW